MFINKLILSIWAGKSQLIATRKIIAIWAVVNLLICSAAIAGGRPDEFRLLHPEVMKAVQNELRKMGFDPGHSDGLFGPKTEYAIMQFCRRKGIKYTKKMDPDFIDALWGIKFDYKSAVENNQMNNIMEFYQQIGIKHF